jgi:hypothetical protein
VETSEGGNVRVESERFIGKKAFSKEAHEDTTIITVLL